MPSTIFRVLLFPAFCALAAGAFAAGDHAMTSEELLDTAMAEYERGDYADAEEDVGEFIRRNPEEASAHFNRALARYQLAKLADAEADLDVHLSMDPRSAAAFELRAFVRLGRGNVAGALADANVGLRIQEAPGLRAARGRALTGKGEYEEAVKDLDIALAANEADDEARFARGDCHLNLG
ncbi:MAG TPA: tetratricopeptide repeat protein, partial [Opitutus sp.]|nr:tetratricopeptide repeat protein [Opitutus sp.]